MARGRRRGSACSGGCGWRWCGWRGSSYAIMGVQLASWCAAACLLLYRGATTLRRAPPPRPPPGFNFTLANRDDNATEPCCPYLGTNTTAGWMLGSEGGGVSTLARLRRELRPASLLLLVLGSAMLLVAPLVLALRRCDTAHRSQRRELKADCDAPPSYAEATRLPRVPYPQPESTEQIALPLPWQQGAQEQAPRYSMLFDVESGEPLLPPPPPTSPGPSSLPAEASTTELAGR